MFMTFHIFMYIILYLNAVEGTDYTVADPFEVTFAAGSGNSASFSGFMALQDTSIEGDHNFAVSLESVPVQFMNNVNLDPSTVEVTIVDDDGQSLIFSIIVVCHVSEVCEWCIAMDSTLSHVHTA